MFRRFAVILIVFISISLGVSQTYQGADNSTQAIELYEKFDRHFTGMDVHLAQPSMDSLARLLKNHPQLKTNKAIFEDWYYAEVFTLFCKNKLSFWKSENDVNELRDFVTKENLIQSKSPILEALDLFMLGEIDHSTREKGYGMVHFENAMQRLKKSDHPRNIELLVRVQNRIGSAYYMSRKFDESLAAYKAGEIFIRTADPIDSLKLALSYYLQGRVYSRTRRYDENLKYWNDAGSIVKNHLGEKNGFAYRVLNAMTVYHARQLDYRKTIDVCKELLLAYNQDSIHANSIAGTYRRMANSYKSLDQIDLSNKYLKKGLDIMETCKNKHGISTFYNDLGIRASTLTEQQNFYEKALAICDQDPACGGLNQSIYLNNIADVYRRQGDFVRALNALNKTKEFYESDLELYRRRVTSTYGILGSTYDGLGNKERGLFYLKKSLQMEEAFKKDTARIIQKRTNLALFLIKENDYNEARKILNSCLKLLRNSSMDNLYSRADTYAKLSYLNEMEGNLELAVEQIKKSTAYNLKLYGRRSIDYNYNLCDFADLYKKLGHGDSVLMIKNKFLNNFNFQYNETKDEFDHQIPRGDLYVAFKTFAIMLTHEKGIVAREDKLVAKVKAGLRMIDRLRAEDEYQLNTKDIKSTYRMFLDWAIEELSASIESNSSQQKVNLLYNCFEKSKSISINRAFNQLQALRENEVDEETILEEKRLSTSHEKALVEFINSSETSDSLRLQEEINLRQLANENQVFLENLKRNYPEYYALKYDPNVVPLSKVRSLLQKENKGLIQFHTTDSLVYIMEIATDDFNVRKVLISDLLPSLQSFKELCNKRKGLDNEASFLKGLEEFKNHASHLYELLLEESPNFSNVKNWLIIPSGALVNLSFDALLENSAVQINDYRLLPFVLKSHTLSYVGSCSEVVNLFEYGQENNYSSYVGFGPTYNQNENAKKESSRSGSLEAPLNYNVDEIERSAEIFSGNKYLESEATKGQFLNAAPNQDILHLAMHASANGSNPLESYLSFTNDQKDKYESRLYAHEIAQINLENELVVLSACETNAGVETNGEGLLGIAKSFQLASSPNILLSNWLIDDLSANILILDFLKGVKENLNPASSLREAKLDYLRSANMIQGHPSYWAGFNFYGNPFIKKSKGLNSGLLISLCTVLFLLFFIISLKK